MNGSNFIREGLLVQHLPVYETDIPYIHSILSIIQQTQGSLEAFPNLNEEIPILIVDKALLR
ncbi:hypothetical protein [Lederbergia galactosidilytica]|uniref:Uncharacterized protein n=1 Tax=Lederbergia galactosidilytica TaxID=217031 RepID=A0A0Q9YM06_9BACI|nr:hypothetical protein [Lederbergia galactosidilytica]KRG13172.1 hypothetical protein ACA30_16355 [Virgibacillus soli]KRG17064.1 hypothetical protein ACA29_00760 [Lederbergia galactosidilytica]MBP1916492.1 hypothetical protein [Lederbergia galactosidilytica]OAK73549.1 hypothetical protein ABB05_06885 [Lederbergia galactosidilytica]